MATPIEALKEKRLAIESSLQDSPTAYARDTSPSSTDLNFASQLSSINKQIESLRSEQIRSKWYGTGDDLDDTPSAPDGWFVGGLKALMKPTNVIIGAGQYALGKGTESNLVANINEAMRKGLTAGDVLKQYGVKRGVQVPLGFALDVMLDPINWITAGTVALIPRVGMGLIKGGVKGGVVGLTSNVARKAAVTARFLPFKKRVGTLVPDIKDVGKVGAVKGVAIKGAEGYSTMAERLGAKAIEGAEKYDIIVGKDVYDRLGKGIFGMREGVVGKTLEEAVRGKTDLPGLSFLKNAAAKPAYAGETVGDKFTDFFKYSPREAAEIADLNDKVINLAKTEGAILVRTEAKADFASIDEFMKPGATIQIKDKMGDMMEVSIRDADGVVKQDYIGTVKIYDNIDNARTLLETAGEDYSLRHLTKAYQTTPAGKTGARWYDDKISRLKNTTLKDLKQGRLGPIIRDIENDGDELVKAWNSLDDIVDLKPFEKTLNTLESLLSLFKSAKVPMNVSSHVVANIGNLFMGAMMGLPVNKAEYFNSLVRANQLVKGNLGAIGFKRMFFDDVGFNALIDMADNNPTRFTQVTGIDPREIAQKLVREEQVLRSATGPELKKILLKEWELAEQGIADIERVIIKEGESLSKYKEIATEAAELGSKSKADEILLKDKMGRFKTPSEHVAKILKESPGLRRGEEIGSWMTSEITPNARLDKIKKYFEEAAVRRPNNIAIRLLNGMVNTMPRWYEHIDQTFKIGTTDYLMKIGLTEQELINVSRTINITREDLLDPIIKGGEKLYRLKGLKASEVAVEAYMNYAAMPDFVRTVRALPIVGSPFLSFPYAMAIKTSKTVIHNPAIFNKIGFMMSEMNAGRSPAEKHALESKYNEYLNSPTVVKIGGMWNTDIKNIVPYFTLNMFNPSERTYDNSMQGRILKLADKSPLFQHPAGAVLRDYMIQPWILTGSGQAPQGQFGQPLFPAFDETGKAVKASLGTKAFYAGRTLAEALVPGTFGYLGLPIGMAKASPGFIDYLPSYGARNLANAVQGRSTIGAMTKEDAIRKGFRSILGRSGFPAYTLDTSKIRLTDKK